MKLSVHLLFILALSGLGSVCPADNTPRFNHAALYVVDLTTSRTFYRDVVGLKEIPEPFRDGKHAWFDLGQKTALHLISGASPSGPKEKRNHLCLSVDSMTAFTARLGGQHIAYEDVTGRPGAVTRRPDGVQQIYFRDPDGNWLEINDARE
jgi:lactoylglutathione lyase